MCPLFFLYLNICDAYFGYLAGFNALFLNTKFFLYDLLLDYWIFLLKL